MLGSSRRTCQVANCNAAAAAAALMDVMMIAKNVSLEGERY